MVITSRLRTTPPDGPKRSEYPTVIDAWLTLGGAAALILGGGCVFYWSTRRAMGLKNSFLRSV
jgi:hypothetical protein